MGKDRPEDAPLNPDIQRRFDETYDTSATPPPLSTVKARGGAQGEMWPLVWLAVVLISVVVAIYILL